nr:immunoglobulin light chain junction region [Macaca mulatta]MOX50763.1 immunoglobulin light chain junction region [Macaca mulatta]
CLQYNSGPLTF